jgi:hypothetical protein
MQVAWLDLWGAWKGGAALGTSIYDVSIPKFFDLMVMAGIPRTKLVKDTQHTHAPYIPMPGASSLSSLSWLFSLMLS